MCVLLWKHGKWEIYSVVNVYERFTMKNMENEKHTLEHGIWESCTEKHGKWETHTVEHCIWASYNERNGKWETQCWTWK